MGKIAVLQRNGHSGTRVVMLQPVFCWAPVEISVGVVHGLQDAAVQSDPVGGFGGRPDDPRGQGIGDPLVEAVYVAG